MKDCVFACCHVGCGAINTSVDCLLLTNVWCVCRVAVVLLWGLHVFCHLHTLMVTTYSVAHYLKGISKYKDKALTAEMSDYLGDPVFTTVKQKHSEEW